jgi:hypothetical protein
MTSYGVDPKLCASLSGAELTIVYLKIYIVHSLPLAKGVSTQVAQIAHEIKSKGRVTRLIQVCSTLIVHFNIEVN